jgi:uncharacterized protein (DUF1330 family)
MLAAGLNADARRVRLMAQGARQTLEKQKMAKGYWVSVYKKIMKPEQAAEYAKIATQAIAEGGGRPLVRGVAAMVQGEGVIERTVVIEFDSLDAAVAAYNSATYQHALEVLGDSVVRDFRIVEGAA